MPLTALQHQKAAALQQISSLSYPSGMADPAMMKSAVNRMIPLISQWERSDPEFSQLGILLRRARVKPTPNTLAAVSAQAQRMVSILRTGLGHRTNRAGEKQVWDPGRGHVTSPLFEEGEPVRTFSPMGWRGSKKYPFGKAFPEKNLIEGLSGIQRPGFLAGAEPLKPAAEESNSRASLVLAAAGGVSPSIFRAIIARSGPQPPGCKCSPGVYCPQTRCVDGKYVAVVKPPPVLPPGKVWCKSGCPIIMAQCKAEGRVGGSCMVRGGSRQPIRPAQSTVLSPSAPGIPTEYLIGAAVLAAILLLR